MRQPQLELEGFCSHLAEANDAEAPATARQRERFRAALARVRDRGFRPSCVHLDNSAGVVHGPTPETDSVRPGIALYGGDPTLERGLRLEPVMSLLTRVVHARRVLVRIEASQSVQMP